MRRESSSKAEWARKASLSEHRNLAPSRKRENAQHRPLLCAAESRFRSLTLLRSHSHHSLARSLSCAHCCRGGLEPALRHGQ